MSIRIEIDDRYVVTSDSFQFILHEKKTAETGKNAGKEWLSVVGYYPRLNQLVSGLIHHHIQQSSITAVEDMAKEIERVGRLCGDALTSSYCDKYFAKHG
ncbi:hypothetical protein EZM12_10970 [Salmonella enterica]|nr:hypothetical protein [Salmonella enterica]HED0218608.1 DUF5405 family protein [Salmonella enterica subsp. enterica serovar Muenchen]